MVLSAVEFQPNGNFHDGNATEFFFLTLKSAILNNSHINASLGQLKRFNGCLIGYSEDTFSSKNP